MEITGSKKPSIMVYTRQPDAGLYPGGLARSIHFAWSNDGKKYQPLNKNYGILFVEGTIGTDNTIHTKGVEHPWIFSLFGGGYGIMAVRVNEDGSLDQESTGKVLFWTTKDFINFCFQGLLDLKGNTDVKKICCKCDTLENQYIIEWEAADGGIYYNRMICDDLRWNVSKPVSITEFEFEKNNVCMEQSLAEYPEGAIIGNSAELDIILHRQVKREKKEYLFPLMKGYGDPVIFQWNGKYYFTATNDNKNAIGLYVKEAEDLNTLFSEDVESHLILGVDEENEFIQTFWAPEFHIIGGNIYILFAVSGKKWGPQCHMMKLKKDGNILDAQDWERPVKVQKKNGEWLSTDGITLDMTYLEAGGDSYVVWSYRQNIGTPLDTGSMLYIAKADIVRPWKLASDPVLLSRPLLGWENVDGTINNEGPFAYVTDDKVYLTYSGGASDSYTYAVGLLTARTGSDLLDISVWSKRSTPVLSFYSLEGVYGPGHSSFFKDHEGNLMIAFHGETGMGRLPRCIGIGRVHFGNNGEPLL